MDFWKGLKIVGYVLLALVLVVAILDHASKTPTVSSESNQSVPAPNAPAQKAPPNSNQSEFKF